MSDVDDLVVWLRAQLDVDEQLAREAGGDGAAGRWVEGEPVGAAVGSEAGDSVVFENMPPTLGQQQHIAEHDPARVLAEVDAKRRILDEHQRVPMVDCWCSICDVPGDIPGLPHGCNTVRLLALPYADRPGYQEAWRP